MLRPMLELSTAFLHTLATLAQEAGRAVMVVYARADVGLVHKADESPLTQADLAADAIILQVLHVERRALDNAYASPVPILRPSTSLSATIGIC